MIIKGLIFDFDGLILDTEIAEFQSWTEFFTSYHLKLPFTEWSACIGTSNKSFDVYKYFEKQLGRHIKREEIDRVRGARLNEIVSSLTPLPGVIELIKEAKETGLKIGLASSSSYEWVSTHLTRLNIISLFNTIHTREEVIHVKPDPALYLNALNKLQLSNNEVVAFEDSPNGIRASNAAGIFCIAVPNQLTMMMDTSQAKLVLPSLKGISLEKIQTFYDQKGNHVQVKSSNLIL